MRYPWVVVGPTRRTRSQLFAHAARLLGRVESRLVLSTAIIISLLPFDWVSNYDAPFLLLFGVEFVLRAVLVMRGTASTTPGIRRSSSTRSAGTGESLPKTPQLQ